MTAQKAKQISNKVLVIAASAIVLAGYQNCSKIRVADNVLSASTLAASGNNDVVVATDTQDNVIPVDVEHPAAEVSAAPTPAPSPVKETTVVVVSPSPSASPSPSTVVKNPPEAEPVSPPKMSEEHRDFCGHDKKDFENAIDVDQFRLGEVELKHECHGKTLVYSSSGKGHLKGLHTGSSEGKFVICKVKIDKIRGKKGHIKIFEGSVREIKEFKGDLEDGDCSKHDNREHTLGENNNRDHKKCKLN